MKFSGGLGEKFSLKNWEGRPRILDQEIGSHPSYQQEALYSYYPTLFWNQPWGLTHCGLIAH